jgi:hypothetical protein
LKRFASSRAEVDMVRDGSTETKVAGLIVEGRNPQRVQFEESLICRKGDTALPFKGLRISLEITHFHLLASSEDSDRLVLSPLLKSGYVCNFSGPGSNLKRCLFLGGCRDVV